MPGMVGRERRGGRQRRAGRAVTYAPVQPTTSLGGPPTPWWTQKGRGRLGHRETTSPEHTARSAVNVPDRRCALVPAVLAGSGTSSDRGLSNSYAYGSVFSSLRTCVATVPIRTPSSAATA